MTQSQLKVSVIIAEHFIISGCGVITIKDFRYDTCNHKTTNFFRHFFQHFSCENIIAGHIFIINNEICTIITIMIIQYKNTKSTYE